MATPGTSVLESLAVVGGVAVRRGKGERAFFFLSKLAIDADGAPSAYHPALPRRPSGSPPGLDDLRNAGRPGNWFAIVTDAAGRPVVQGEGDPAPGFFVSMTALVDRGHPRQADPHRYVNAETIPYVVLSPTLTRKSGTRLGDLATVWNRRNGKLAQAIFADVGPDDEVGEGSIALARALGIPDNPRTGGQAGDVAYVVFPGSGNGRPRAKAEVAAAARLLFRDWGGLRRLKRLFPAKP